MFKINELVMYGNDGSEFTYCFSSGLNYFKGGNDTGKTGFYEFIDYMLGSSVNISNKLWYQGSLAKARMEICVNHATIELVRTLNVDINYIYYQNEKQKDPIELWEYRERINAMISPSDQALRNLHRFADEEFTYRTFTMFNFLGEKRQGNINDFLDKCSDIKYSIKLTPILNFIFNRNVEELFKLQKELEDLTAQLKAIDNNNNYYSFLVAKINKALDILHIPISYNGANAREIEEKISELKSMQPASTSKQDIDIAELQVLYNNTCEQIKIYETTITDATKLEKTSRNRKYLLERLQKLVVNNSELTYLTEPLTSLLNELDNTIAFSQYTMHDDTIQRLKVQRQQLTERIKKQKPLFECYSVDQKQRAIALVEDYLSADISDRSEEASELRKKVKDLKERIKSLQHSDDRKKIDQMSTLVTELYMSAKDFSTVVEEDAAQEGFIIQYNKKGNMLQPMISTVEKDDEGNDTQHIISYDVGSLARHTLIQLCGYFAFLKIMIDDNIYPLVPILVIDHISKPFDPKNAKAIGRVIEKAYELIGKNRLQIFMFDHANDSDLGLLPDHSEQLTNTNKTGFNPFFHPIDDNAKSSIN